MTSPPQALKLLGQPIAGTEESACATEEVQQSQAHPGHRSREQFGQQTASQLSRVVDGCVQRRDDFRLQSRLLVKPDLQVGEQQQLGPGFLVWLIQNLMIVRESSAQPALPLGRFTGSQAGAESRQLLVVWLTSIERSQETRKLVADLLEHLVVAACHRIAAPLKGRRGIDGLPQRCRGARDTPCALPGKLCPVSSHLPNSLLRSARVVDQILQRADQIFLSDALSSLLGCPRGHRAPIGALAHQSGHCYGQLVIALSDSEIAHHRIS